MVDMPGLLNGPSQRHTTNPPGTRRCAPGRRIRAVEPGDVYFPNTTTGNLADTYSSQQLEVQGQHARFGSHTGPSSSCHYLLVSSHGLS